MADNVEILMRDKGDPVVFYFDICLESERATVSQGGSRQSLPTLPNSGASKASEPAAKKEAGPVKISKALLRCIQAKRAGDASYFEKEPVVFNASNCQK